MRWFVFRNGTWDLRKDERTIDWSSCIKWCQTFTNIDGNKINWTTMQESWCLIEDPEQLTWPRGDHRAAVKEPVKLFSGLECHREIVDDYGPLPP